jgi:hypothetical protein
MLTHFLSSVFGQAFKDILSGYRVFSRRFVKSFPVLSDGFEIETELTVHALQLRVPIAELPTPYRERPPGSFSKLKTYRDGLRILRTIGSLLRDERPMAFFGCTGLIAALASIVLVIPLFEEYMRTGLVPRLPTAVLATGLMIIACLSFTCGLILQTVTRGRLELKRLHYSSIPLKTPQRP